MDRIQVTKLALCVSYKVQKSMFVGMAQSRAGAEPLLEAQLPPLLTQCDYLGTRPKGDQVLIGGQPVRARHFHR